MTGCGFMSDYMRDYLLAEHRDFLKLLLKDLGSSS